MLDVVLEAHPPIAISNRSIVSILVVLDVVLEVCYLMRQCRKMRGFNPCCAGCSSGRTLRQRQNIGENCFNPCCAGCSSGRQKAISEIVKGLRFQSLLCWM